MSLKKFLALLPPKDFNDPVVPVLDWLSFSMNIAEDTIPEPTTDGDSFPVNDSISLRYIGKGNEHYKYIWQVNFKGEHLATLLSHTRNEKFVRKGVVKLDIKNHLLYTTQLWPFYNQLVAALNLQYRNITRMDIAIDGLNYLIKFVNAYLKQTPKNKVVEMVGRTAFRSGIMDKKTMLFHSFKMGGNKSKKQITIYNKTKEIVKSQKDYIQRFWKENGISNSTLNLQVLLEEMKEFKEDEPMDIAEVQNIFRFELRLSGQIIKEIVGFNLSMLQTPNGLMSIVNKFTENFFDFVIKTQKENTKCKRLDVLPFSKFKLFPIELSPVRTAEDLYKTKLSIKKNVRQLYLGNLQPSDYAVAQMFIFDVNNYNLQQWYNDRLAEWHRMYEYINNNVEYVESVYQYLQDMNQHFIDNTEGDLLI